MIMKNTVWILLTMLLGGCVPLKEYRVQSERLNELTLQNKQIRKEIRDLQKEQKILKDTIVRREERNTAVSNAVQKRLESYRIRIKMNPEAIKGLYLRHPDPDKELYKSMWNTYTSRDTHAAAKISWLSKDEKEIYYYLNYARLDPKGFCNRYVMPKLRYDSNNVYLLTLIDYMYTMGPRNAVTPDREQYDAAKCHAETSGVLNYIGHERQDKKCKKLFSGECCSYGVSSPLGVVLQLLIDQGVSSLGHRYICLGWYEKCGIAMAPHKGFTVNTVLDFD